MGRNAAKAETTISSLKGKHPQLSISFIRCDMTSLASVQKAADEFLSVHPRLDVFVANAGIMCADAAVTDDGYQIEFQTNHLSHALLIKKLLPLLQSTAAKGNDVRIINLSSIAYKSAPDSGIDFATLKTPQATLGRFLVPGHRWSRYGQTKLANILYANALAKRYPDILSVSLHPGYIFTDLWKTVPLAEKLAITVALMGKSVDPDKGAYTQLWAATASRDVVKTGTYYEPVGVATQPTTKLGRDEGGKLADKLWEWTQEALADYN